MSRVSTWEGGSRWIPSAWFHFHSCQTWYSGLLRIVLIAHQCWNHPKHRNQARMEKNWTGSANSTCGVGVIGRPTVISGRYNKCYSLQLHNHYALFPPLQHTFMQNTTMRNWSWEMIMSFEALYAGRDRRNPVWSGKETHWSIRGLIVKSAEHCGADYKPWDRYYVYVDVAVEMSRQVFVL